MKRPGFLVGLTSPTLRRNPWVEVECGVVTVQAPKPMASRRVRTSVFMVLIFSEVFKYTGFLAKVITLLLF
jgi:hypothetical protein